MAMRSGDTLTDPGGRVVRLTAGPVVWLSGLADDAATLRRQTVERPAHSIAANLRNLERVYAWMIVGVVGGFGGVAVVLLLEPVLGKPVADTIFRFVMSGGVFAAASAGLSGLRAAAANRWGWLVFPEDAMDKEVRLRLRRRERSGAGRSAAGRRRRMRMVRWACQPSPWDLLVAAIVAVPFYFGAL
ncbi:hypothetical protein GCM10010399_52450 [Dactylosporangium fulvum]|uniref:Uncharacterized protein n=1 Tax=Dactylosporangium fulvum TaxID=53359 RepID=A0ABY5WB83_9ACTN|nr:hypothetical protein [Dactylosporangium fulvum]UWP86371.1 hypothetical protein Dfulv_19870 [Dactylosporangium fulvum]